MLAPNLQRQIELLANPFQVPAAFITLITTRVPDTTSLIPQPRVLVKSKNISGEYLCERIKHSISVYDFVRSDIGREEYLRRKANLEWELAYWQNYIT